MKFLQYSLLIFLLFIFNNDIFADSITREILKDSFLYKSSGAIINLKSLDQNQTLKIDFSLKDFNSKKLDRKSKNELIDNGGWIKLTENLICSEDNRSLEKPISFSGEVLVGDYEIYLSSAGEISTDGFEDTDLNQVPIILRKIKFRGLVEIELNPKIKNFIIAPSQLEGVLHGITETRKILLYKIDGARNSAEYFFDISISDFEKFSYLRISEQPRFGLSVLSFPLSNFRKTQIHFKSKEKPQNPIPVSGGKVITQGIRPRFNLEVELIGSNELRSPAALILTDSLGGRTRSKLSSEGNSTWIAKFSLLDWRKSPFKTELEDLDFTHVPLFLKSTDYSTDDNVTLHRKTYFANKWKILYLDCLGVENAAFLQIRNSDFLIEHFNSAPTQSFPIEDGIYSKTEELIDPLGVQIELLNNEKEVIWPPLQDNQIPWHKSKHIEIEPVGRNEYEARIRIPK